MALDWEETTVGQFSPFEYGKGLPQNLRNINGSVPVYGSGGIVGYHNHYLLSRPAVIIGRKGSIGSIYYSEIPSYPIDTTFYVEEIDETDIKFIYYLLQSLGLSKMNSDSAVPGLNRNTAHAVRIRVPADKVEQHAIADILGSLDDKIELNRRMNATLEETARALFKSWFVDFDPVRAKMEGRQPEGIDAETAALFPDRLVESALGLIPEGWQVSTIKEVVEFAYGKALKEEVRKPGQVPVYGSNGQIGWHHKALVKAPGIVIGRKGNPGTVTWVQSDFFR